MQGKKNFRLIHRAEILQIPSDFPFLSDVDPDIYKQLITKGEYNVKSKVEMFIFQSFIDYWVSKEVPLLNRSNVFEYSQLSSEFDIMKNIIQIFQRQKENVETSSLAKNNYCIEKNLKKKKDELLNNSKKYHQIIYTLFNNENVIFPNNQELYYACINFDTVMADLLTRKTMIDNGILYTLNDIDKTAGVLRSISSNENIFIPRSVFYESQEYIVTIIHFKAFYKQKVIKSIQFSEDSELRIIDDKAFEKSSIENIIIPPHVSRIGESSFCFCFNLNTIEFSQNSELETIRNDAFFNSSIQQITIPSSVTEIGKESFGGCDLLKSINFQSDSRLKTIPNDFLMCTTISEFTIPPNVESFQDYWCFEANDIKMIKLMPNCKNFLCCDNKYIIGKSDIKSDNYDTLVFVHRDIEKVTIPSFIKYIGPYAFQLCNNLKSIEFADDSQLEIIDTSFSNSAIESISIPASVRIISQSSFWNCNKLKNVEFKRNSNLEYIGRCAFAFSSIESISIPSNVEDLDEVLCNGTSKLININVIPTNDQKIISYEDKFVLGKSDKNSDIYDILLFARRDLESATIPSFITKIASNAFSKCSIKNIEFHDDSQLVLIDNNAFYSSHLESICIPSNVVNIGQRAFKECNELETVEFQHDSKLKIIDEDAFINTHLINLSIPSSVTVLKEGCFSFDFDLTNINVFPNNIHNIIFFDNKYIIGKSDIKSDIFDVLLFARSDITSAKIPSFIRKIGLFAFTNCNNLINIEFSDDSQLTVIGKNAFEATTLNSISIPRHVTRIEYCAFAGCKNLKNISIHNDSELISIGDNAFDNTIIESFYFPPNLTHFNHAFSSCFYLNLIEIDENSKFQLMYYIPYLNRYSNTIMIPRKLRQQFCQVSIDQSFLYSEV